MSYSFTVRGATKEAVLVALAAEVDKIVADQPMHARDAIQIAANADGAASLLEVDATKDVCISCNGSLSWGATDPADNPPITSASINVWAYLDTRAEKP